MTDDHASTWRDLTDQLTREQIVRLQAAEHEGSHADSLLHSARTQAEQNMIEGIYSSEPLPADSAGSIGWGIHKGGWSRLFRGNRRIVEDVATLPAFEIYDEDGTRNAEVDFGFRVEIWGEQFTDGTISRAVTLDYRTEDLKVTEKAWESIALGDFNLSPDAARRLGAALIAAADEIDKLSES